MPQRSSVPGHSSCLARLPSCTDVRFSCTCHSQFWCSAALSPTYVCPFNQIHRQSAAAVAKAGIQTWEASARWLAMAGKLEGGEPQAEHACWGRQGPYRTLITSIIHVSATLLNWPVLHQSAAHAASTSMQGAGQHALNAAQRSGGRLPEAAAPLLQLRLAPPARGAQPGWRSRRQSCRFTGSCGATAAKATLAEGLSPAPGRRRWRTHTCGRGGRGENDQLNREIGEAATTTGA